MTAAWEKERQGYEVTLLDSAKRAGGVIESVKDEGFLLDYGPNTLSLRLAKTEAMLRDLGILDHAIDANPEAVKRFVVRKGCSDLHLDGPASVVHDRGARQRTRGR